MNEQTRICRKCGREKPIASFPKRYGKKAHLREHTCGVCKLQRHRALNPGQRAAQCIRARARKKGLSVEQYHATKGRRIARNPTYLAQKHRLRIDGLIVRKNQKRRCPLLSAYPKIEYQVNRQYYLNKSREYCRANPDKSYAKKLRRKMRLAGVVNDLTPLQWQGILRMFRYRCAYCGKGGKLTQDHITPITKRGGHTASNVVPACQRCNSSKHAGPPPCIVQPVLLI